MPILTACDDRFPISHLYMRFDEFDLSDDILDALDDMHFEKCTPIQEKAIPVIIEGHDLIACAQTGTGKTAAYLLPVLDRIADDKYYEEKDCGTTGSYIRCIIMSPTRELARQIDSLLQGFAYYINVGSLAVYGGTDGAGFSTQKNGLVNGSDVVIASPGRLLDHIAMGYVNLSHVSHFILDEADRMLDMGFYDDIMQIAKRLPKERQTLMFSATMPVKTRRLAKEILHEPKEISLEVSKPTEKIDQSKFVCYEPQKTPLLKKLFKDVSARRVLVFASSKLKVKELTRELRREHYNAVEMHSDLDQLKRDEVMRDFKARKIDILVATDILSRGIDIDNISMVVNYDVPHEPEDYVHRVGRTARAENDGVAVTFVSEKERRKFSFIEKFLGYEVRRREIPEEYGGEAGKTDKSNKAKKTNKANKPNRPDKVNNAASSESEQKPAVKKRRKYYHRRKPKGENGGGAGKSSGAVEPKQ